MAEEDPWARDRAEFVRQAEHRGRYPGGVFPSPLVAQFTELTRGLLACTSVGEVLERVVDATYRLVEGADLVSVTLRSPSGEFFTPVETDPVASELDQVQYRAGEGPCVDAARLDGPGHVHSDDLAGERAWPDFAKAASNHGFVAVLATTLLPDARPPRLAGALNIYSRRRGLLGPEAANIALLLATHASLALAGTEAVERAELREAQLRRALDSRDVIGQAKGILMHRRGIGADEAFDLLRETSQQLNVKLAELAAMLASRHTEIDPTDR
ncbi:ANTAR domain-containing protein [Amycolatopsis echigonensis]|uniref:GAF and ANTAR domain-containing protein n=2 Tax=Amycolatopsis echigonensis TaxID=2576905 RepID=A0A8E1VY40_9PSEU|nr:GAF and ANTAR domain-containing protein [Amycolatopsis echigonensis]MBB2500456.1 GAF and ANTAR domain-containing protein [Amycolatopsis echigonensis]